MQKINVGTGVEVSVERVSFTFDSILLFLFFFFFFILAILIFILLKRREKTKNFYIKNINNTNLEESKINNSKLIKLVKAIFVFIIAFIIGMLISGSDLVGLFALLIASIYYLFK
ncbi:MAG: hypothetical protein QXG39_00175 [Candidatus Aenigmatarchaeota archaeon]